MCIRNLALCNGNIVRAPRRRTEESKSGASIPFLKIANSYLTSPEIAKIAGYPSFQKSWHCPPDLTFYKIFNVAEVERVKRIEFNCTFSWHESLVRR